MSGVGARERPVNALTGGPVTDRNVSKQRDITGPVSTASDF